MRVTDAVVRHGGRISDTVNDETSHVIVHGDMLAFNQSSMKEEAVNATRKLRGGSGNRPVQIVPVTFVMASIRSSKLYDARPFHLVHHIYPHVWMWKMRTSTEEENTSGSDDA